jgi:DNA invertase Pin-like site-specific DNA recombinase
MTSNVLIYRRFSSDEQEGGDSLARQSRVCEAFALKMGWTILDTITDKGRSAFKAEHLLPDAALGGFAAQVFAGEIPDGTILLAERLDRISRRPVGEAMAWIHALTSLGVQIALADKGKVFAANMSLEDFFGFSISFAQSHEESAKKSELITSAKTGLWGMAERREGKWTNLAARHPTWLKRNETKNGWVVDEARARIVRDIYQWSADGLGVVVITRRLNAIPVKPFGIAIKDTAKPTWGRSAVRQFLNNRAVEGDLVPVKGMFEGKVLHDFYPRIVDADIVAKARAQQTARTKAAGVRSSTGTSNLFAGITFCGECGKKAFLTSSVNKGRRYAYVKCEGALDGRDCTNTGYYAYQAFEDTALELCLDLALDDRFFEATGELREGQIKQAELEKAIADKRARRKRIMSAFDDDDQDAIDLARNLKVEIESLTAQLVSVREALERASGRVGAVEHLRRVGDIREAAKSDNPMVREQARGKLRQAFSAILYSVSAERTTLEPEFNVGGPPVILKVFTLTFLEGILGVRIDTKGRIVDAVDQALGKPLWDCLTTEQRAVAEPLIKRIKAQREDTASLSTPG